MQRRYSDHAFTGKYTVLASRTPVCVLRTYGSPPVHLHFPLPTPPPPPPIPSPLPQSPPPIPSSHHPIILLPTFPLPSSLFPHRLPPPAAPSGLNQSRSAPSYDSLSYRRSPPSSIVLAPVAGLTKVTPPFFNSLNAFSSSLAATISLIPSTCPVEAQQQWRKWSCRRKASRGSTLIRKDCSILIARGRPGQFQSSRPRHAPRRSGWRMSSGQQARSKASVKHMNRSWTLVRGR